MHCLSIYLCGVIYEPHVTLFVFNIDKIFLCLSRSNIRYPIVGNRLFTKLARDRTTIVLVPCLFMESSPRSILTVKIISVWPSRLVDSTYVDVYFAYQT